MYARVVTGRLNSAALERGIAVLEKQIRPHVSKRPGFQRWELLIVRASGTFQVITYWSSQVEAEGASRDGFTDRARMLDNLLEGELAQTLFEVLA